ncbi:nuclear transport factor 2 family protein [Streptomyces pinistramenti]|uniref:nuclear transport factor 2 family protein n=1 Tax=Streptomyces pinistramenti TaxID=2884812 RepID=UPI001D094DA5|nr:nuclear transport factor 2 family protein [Streptomyces pinistramenti]MCB5911819.1 nuclear transport factor 2 family protein [Streptomyces pinistramenti]
MATTAERFKEAVEKRELGALEGLFTEDVRFFSPVKFRPFEGRTMLLGVFGVLLRTFDDFRYVGELAGAADTAAGPAAGHADSTVLIFRATVNGKEIHGIDLLQYDEAGLIKEFTVMVRPLSAVQALGDAVLAGLVADGLVAGG